MVSHCFFSTIFSLFFAICCLLCRILGKRNKDDIQVTAVTYFYLLLLFASNSSNRIQDEKI